MLYPYPLSAAVAAMTEALPGLYKPTTWLEYKHAEYRVNHDMWVYARDHYTGEVLLPYKIAHYLVQKYLGETPEAFIERMTLADYTPHFSTVVDSLVGMLFQGEADATKRWGALGDPEDRNTPIGKLGLDADGLGHGYETLWRRLAIDLTAIHKAWVIVDGNVPGSPRIRVIPAEAVTNWRYVNGVLVEALVMEDVDVRASIEDGGDPEPQFIRFTTAGWQRYRQEKAQQGQTDAKVVPLTGPGAVGTYRYKDHNGNPTLPLFPISLALPRPVGYILARKANAIFNMESTRDAGLRAASFALLNVIGNDATFKKVTDMLKVGARALPNQAGSTQAHHFIAPSAAPATILTDVLKEKVTNFWRAGFREYGEAASRKTAEEVRQDVAGGVGAFLTMLKAAVDDAENQALWRLEQTLFPNDTAKWFEAKVERSDDFIPFDINWTIERLKQRYFGNATPVPAGRSALLEAARQIAVWDGLPVDEDELEAAVDVQQLTASLQLTEGLPIPPEARADAAVRYMIASGYVDPDDKDDTEPDTVAEDTPLIAKLRAAALEIAKKMPPPTPKAAPAPGGGAGATTFGSPTKLPAGPPPVNPPPDMPAGLGQPRQ